jgi:stearoyl-CoA desaturase (delta-9 desaturase)
LAKNLKRTPDFKIQRARLAMIFKRAQAKIDRSVENPRWRELFETEYRQFRQTIAEWQHLQMERVQLSKQKLADAIDQSTLTARYRELEMELRMQRKRVMMLTAQFYG